MRLIRAESRAERVSVVFMMGELQVANDENDELRE